MNGGKQMESVWTFPVCFGNESVKDSDDNKLHNTQKPINLLYRIITLFTKMNDVVLDPFGCTMTTAVVAKMTGRHYINIECDPKYIEYGEERLENTKTHIGDVEQVVYILRKVMRFSHFL